MNFMESQTIVNLGRAFAGESQAKNRYLFYASQAEKEGLVALANLIRAIAWNEYQHAKVFYEHIISRVDNGDLPNLNIDAGYPFEQASTMQNMLFAATGEHHENAEIYPKFADIAKEEGFPQVENSFRMIAQIEGEHNKIFTKLNQKLQNQTLYKSDTPKKWKCSICGHEHESTGAWESCPVCGHAQGFVEIILD